MSLSRNHELVTQDYPWSLLWAVSCGNYILCTKLPPPPPQTYHSAEGSVNHRWATNVTAQPRRASLLFTSRSVMSRASSHHYSGCTSSIPFPPPLLMSETLCVAPLFITGINKIPQKGYICASSSPCSSHLEMCLRNWDIPPIWWDDEGEQEMSKHQIEKWEEPREQMHTSFCVVKQLEVVW